MIIPFKIAPRLVYLVNMLQNMLFCIPILMLYYQSKGVFGGDFFLIQSISLAAVFFLEIPTGYIADLFSRKITLIIGLLGWICGYFCWILGYGFTFILLGELIFSIGISFISGTLDAYLYDLLKQNKKQHLYHKKLSKMVTCGNIGLLTATLSGGFFYEFSGTNSPAILSIIFLLLGILIMIFLPDVKENRRKVQKGKSKLKDILDISKSTIKNKQIKWLMIFPAIYGSLTLTLMWGLQSVMIATKIPVFMFSIVLGANALTRTIWSMFAGMILDKAGLKKSVIILCFLIIISLISAILATNLPIFAVYICLLLMIVSSGSRSLISIVSTTLINHQIQSDERATVLSVKNMTDKIASCIAMLLLKPLFDHFSVTITFMIISLFIIPVIMSAYHLIKLQIPSQEKKDCSLI